MNPASHCSNPAAIKRPDNPNAACLAHCGAAPTARAREKEALVLCWLGVFGITTTAIVKRLLAIRGDGYLPKLQRDGLVHGRALGKMTEKVWTLTSQGAIAAQKLLGRRITPIRGDKVNLSTADHDLRGQEAALRLLTEAGGVVVDNIQNLRSDHELRRTLGTAAPDVVYADCNTEGGVSWLAFEIERNAKGEAELTSKMRRLIALGVSQEHCDRLHIAWIINGQEPVRVRYERTWEATCEAVRKEMMREAFPDEREIQRIAQLRFPTSSFESLPGFQTDLPTRGESRKLLRTLSLLQTEL